MKNLLILFCLISFSSFAQDSLLQHVHARYSNPKTKQQDFIAISFYADKISVKYPGGIIENYECVEYGYETKFEDKSLYSFKGKDVGGYLIFNFLIFL